jgi:hypothetical protein
MKNKKKHKKTSQNMTGFRKYDFYLVFSVKEKKSEAHNEAIT